MADTGFVEVNGARLYHERHGGGPPVVLVHGATLDHRMWRPQVDALAGRFEVITCDLRGFGRSDPPAGRFVHGHDVAALIERLGCGPAVVVGHSIGALYALEACFARPEAVAGFVSLCMSGLGEPSFPDDIVARFGEIRQAARGGALDRARALWAATGWFASVRAHPEAARLVDTMLADYSGWYWLNDSPAANLDPPVATRLDQLAVPALVIDGGLDLPYNRAVAEILAGRLREVERCHLPGAGHFANLEDPAAVSQAIAGFAARGC